MSRAVLFLDFDGVMHPERCECDQYFCKLEQLEQWLRQRSDVDIVISSSWREVHPIDEIRRFFSDDLQSRVIGVTPVARKSDWAQLDGELLPIRFVRQAEVEAWLRENDRASNSWAALDDQAWLFKPFNDRLVVCDRTTGLTQLDLDQVDIILRSGHSMTACIGT